MFTIFDIETLYNLSTWCFKDVATGTRKEFVLFDNSEQFDKLITFLRSLKKHKYTLIGFNSLNFDAQIIEFILNKKMYSLLTIQDIVKAIHTESQRIINLSDDERYDNLIPEWKLTHSHLDLFKISHFDNRAKQTSLKWLEFTMRLPNIQEMPVEHDTVLTKEDIPTVLEYNWNDVEATEAYYNVLKGNTTFENYKGIDVFALREDIKSEFGINCQNYNDVKIGDSINRVIYSDLCGIRRYDLPKRGTERPQLIVKECIGEGFVFTHPVLKEFYERFLERRFNPRKVKEDPGEEFKLDYLNISFGFGGLHSIDGANKYDSNDEYYLSDKDCTGMYPRNIIERNLYPAHLGPNWNKGVKYVYDKRAYEYKPKAKKDKRAQSFSESFKYAANGGSFGKTNEPNSWQYDPLVAFSVTLYNQFALLKYCEMMILNGIKVVSVNTDGVLCYVKNTQRHRNQYNNLGERWERLTLHQLEETLYKKFVQTSGNHYLAVTIDDKVKYKGDFEVDKLLYKNPSFMVIPKAIDAYFLKGILPRQFVVNHKDIYDFCGGVKSKSNFKLNFYRGRDITKQQKVTRFYVSNIGGKLQKDFSDGRQVSVISDENVYILNKVVKEELPFHLDNIKHSYYIKKIYEVIDKIEGDKQLNLL